MAGNGWTGAMGIGREGMTSFETSHVSKDDRENAFTQISLNDSTIQSQSLHTEGIPLNLDDYSIVNAAAGWGHSILHIHSTAAGKGTNQETAEHHCLLMAGRPFDFQTLLRIHRLPPFAARFVVSNSLHLETSSSAMAQATSNPEAKGDEATASADVSFFMKVLNAFLRQGDEKDKDGDGAGLYRMGTYPSFTPMNLPNGETPAFSSPTSETTGSNPFTTMAASAGLSAVLSTSGKVYTLGLNQKGQCGIQNSKATFVWEWTQLVFANHEKMPAEPPLMIALALGLQHGLALGENGLVYAWGKGSRGQLGLDTMDPTSKAAHLDSNVPISHEGPSILNTYASTTTDIGIEYAATPIGTLSNVTQISAGWNHSVAISDNQVFIWGKNAQLVSKDESNHDKAKEDGDNINEDYQPRDATHPRCVPGLPPDLNIERISCGSHHTAVLLQDGSVYAMGVASDNATLISHFVKVIPPGHVDASSTLQFKSHFDRTTIIHGEGRQILEFQLWSTPKLREEAVFEPAWVQDIFCEDKVENRKNSEQQEMIGKKSVQMVHRGWQHTLVITKD